MLVEINFWMKREYKTDNNGEEINQQIGELHYIMVIFFY